MRYSISVLVRPEADAEAGDLTNEQWFTGTADVPDGATPSAVLFPGEGEVALFSIGTPVAATVDDVEQDAADAVAQQAAADAVTAEMDAAEAALAQEPTAVVAAVEELKDEPPAADGDPDPAVSPAARTAEHLAVVEASAEEAAAPDNPAPEGAELNGGEGIPQAVPEAAEPTQTGKAKKGK